jgi:transcriptional regulator with XRE-family HTH domain
VTDQAVADGGVAAGSGAQRVDDLTERRFEAMRLALAERRRALGMSMSSLAREVGISPSMVSQIERGQTSPSVATLLSLVAALGVKIDTLFDLQSGAAEVRPATGAGSAPARQAREGLYVVRSGRRATIDIRGGVHWERLTPRPLEVLDFLELVYEPGAESSPELYRHPGIEMVLVLEGVFRIHIGFEQYVLERGDSIQFASSLPHRYVNLSDGVSRAVTVLVPDTASTEGTETIPSP